MLSGEAYNKVYDHHNRRRDATTMRSDYGDATHAPLKIDAVYGYGGSRVLMHREEEWRRPQISLKAEPEGPGVQILYGINRPYGQFKPQMEPLMETYEPGVVLEDDKVKASLSPAGRGHPLPTKMMKNHSNLWTM